MLVASLRGDRTLRGRKPCCAVAYVRRLARSSKRLSAPLLASTRGEPLSTLADWSLVAGPGGRARAGRRRQRAWEEAWDTVQAAMRA